MAGGHFDANKVETAVRTTSSVAKIVTSAEHSGVHYLTWEKQLPPTAPWLEPERLVPGNEVVYWSSQRSLIERSIDAAGDPQLSLRRLPELQLLANAMDDLGVYTAQYNFGLKADWFSAYRNIIDGDTARSWCSRKLNSNRTTRLLWASARGPLSVCSPDLAPSRRKGGRGQRRKTPANRQVRR